MRRSLDQLDVLLGEWIATSQTYPEGRGRTTVTLVEGGKFVRIESTEEKHLFPESSQFVGSDEASDDCTVLYYDERGVHRVYRMSVVHGTWRMWREAPGFNQRYIGEIGKDGRTIDGRWEFSEDGRNWKVDFDLNYEKVGG